MYKLINQNVDAVIDAAEDLGIAAYAELRADLDSLDPSTEIIDWLLWGWVAYLRSGAQRGGQALYS